MNVYTIHTAGLAALESGWLLLKAERRREVLPYDSEEWSPLSPDASDEDWADVCKHHPFFSREVLIAPSLPAGVEPRPCPECEGNGQVNYVSMFGENCPSCGGSGLVADEFQVAVEQWRYIASTRPTAWITCTSPNDTPSVQRRTVIIGAATVTGPAVPVVDESTPWAGRAHLSIAVEPPEWPFIMTYDDGAVWKWDSWDDAEGVEITAEPWASVLEPGDVLWPVTWRKFDEPVVDMPTNDLRCDNCGASASLPLGMTCSDHRPQRIRVPLSLPPVGQWGEVKP